ARWREYRRLGRVLRRRGRVLQSAPNVISKINFLLFLLNSASLRFRKALRTTLITLVDAKSMPGLHRVIAALTRMCNAVLGSDVRWQTLPMPFEVYSDGIDLPVFEEFGAGAAALHLTSEVDRRRLFTDPSYREWFRRSYEKKWTPRAWHRDFHDA